MRPGAKFWGVILGCYFAAAATRQMLLSPWYLVRSGNKANFVFAYIDLGTEWWQVFSLAEAILQIVVQMMGSQVFSVRETNILCLHKCSDNVALLSKS